MLRYIKFAFNNFRTRKLRAFLTILGILIGIAAVVSLISLGQGLQESMQEQFELMGIDKIIITPKGGYFGMGVEGTELSKQDTKTIEKVKGVDKTTGIILKIARVKFGHELKYAWVAGVPLDPDSVALWESVQSMKIKDGRDLKQGDRQKAVIGYRIAQEKFFEKQVKIRDKIEIEGKAFKIVGTLEQIGNTQDDSSILISIEVARELFNEPEKLDLIILNVQPGFDVGDVAEKIKKELRKAEDLEEGEENFEVQTSEDLRGTFNTVFVIVQIVVIGIAAIALLVGGIGIANTMYTSVLERTREIGIMKAVGARNSDIMFIFLIESGLLGLVGGILGVAIGLGISKSVQVLAAATGTTMIKASFNPFLILGALAFSFIIGSISGLMPARRAAMLKPVNALRYE